MKWLNILTIVLLLAVLFQLHTLSRDLNPSGVLKSDVTTAGQGIDWIIEEHVWLEGQVSDVQTDLERKIDQAVLTP